MRSYRVLQVGLGVALMAGAISGATAADMPSGDKDMVPIPKGEFTMGAANIQMKPSTRSCLMPI